MQKATHLALGVAIGGLLFALGFSLEVALLTGFSAFLPDIDFLVDKVWLSPTGKVKELWRKTTGTHGMHRRIFHNIWIGIIWAILVGYLTNWSLLAMAFSLLGFLSHLAIDSLTYTGVYWLWPYGHIIGEQGKFFVHGPISTGSPAEKKIRSGIYAVGAVLFGIGLMRTSWQSFTQMDLTSAAITITVFFAIGYSLMRSFTRATSRITTTIFSGGGRKHKNRRKKQKPKKQVKPQF